MQRKQWNVIKNTLKIGARAEFPNVGKMNQDLPVFGMRAANGGITEDWTRTTRNGGNPLKIEPVKTGANKKKESSPLTRLQIVTLPLDLLGKPSLCGYDKYRLQPVVFYHGCNQIAKENDKI